jgi:hypothetical protein
VENGLVAAQQYVRIVATSSRINFYLCAAQYVASEEVSGRKYWMTKSPAQNAAEFFLHAKTFAEKQDILAY